MLIQVVVMRMQFGDYLSHASWAFGGDHVVISP